MCIYVCVYIYRYIDISIFDANGHFHGDENGMIDGSFHGYMPYKL